MSVRAHDFNATGQGPLLRISEEVQDNIAPDSKCQPYAKVYARKNRRICDRCQHEGWGCNKLCQLGRGERI